MTDELGNGKRRKWRCSLCNKVVRRIRAQTPKPLDSYEKPLLRTTAIRNQVIPTRLAQHEQKERTDETRWLLPALPQGQAREG
jgi:hypothetical protein